MDYVLHDWRSSSHRGNQPARYPSPHLFRGGGIPRSFVELELYDYLMSAFEESDDSDEAWADQVLQNLHLGVTVENQAAADERIPLLLQTPAAVRFLSVEPMLERIDLTRIPWVEGMFIDAVNGFYGKSGQWKNKTVKVDQVIIGGESGSKARPFHLEWAKEIIDQCKESGTKVFMKQTGSNAFYEGQSYKTKSQSGTDPMEWPEWARVQEFV